MIQVSSANLHIFRIQRFQICCIQTKAAGPIPDPWMTLAVMISNVDFMPL